MNSEVLNNLEMFATSRSHFEQASAIATNTNGADLTAGNLAGLALAQSAAAAGGDLGVLNYALTLEHFENVLYRVILKSGLLSGKALAYAHAYGAHENAHVVALTATIKKLGGTPVKEQARYYLPKITSAAAAINTIATVEDVGASAYLGAAPLLKNGDLLTVAVQIYTVEAEHATAWRLLAGMDAVPFDFAPARTMAEVLEIVTPFLTGK